MRKRRIYLETNGCISRALDLKRLQNYFEENGCDIVRCPGQAEDAVFWGCSFDREEEKWSLHRIEELNRERKVRLIVGGCIKDAAAKRFPGVFEGRSLNTKDIEDIDVFFPEFKKKMREIPDANDGVKRNLRHYWNDNLMAIWNFKPCFLRRFRQYYFSRIKRNFIIRISNGCGNNHCTYCSIWRAVGPMRSKAMDVCVKELEKAVRRNRHRIVLVADDLGAYGIDIGKSLPELLHVMADRDPEAVFILEELSPKWVIKYKDELYKMAREGRIISLQTPLQSGSGRILKLMNRGYTAHQASETLREFKRIDPRIRLFTDVIVGFPSETEEDFVATMEIVKSIGFDSLAYFAYDAKNSLVSLTEVPQCVVQERINRLAMFLWKNRIGGGPF